MKIFILLLACSSLTFAKPFSQNSTQNDSEVCEKCKSDVNAFMKKLEDQLHQTEKIIRETCSYLPEEKRQACIDSSIKELEDGFQKYKQMFPAQKVCEYLLMCKKSTKMVFEEVVSSTDIVLDKSNSGETSCDECKSFVNGFLKYLEGQNKLAVEVVKQICSYFPEDKRKNCDGLVQDLEEGMVQYKAYFTPEKVCKFLLLCKP